MLPFAQLQGGLAIVILLGLALAAAALLMRSHRYFARQRREGAGIPPPGSTLRRDPAHPGPHTGAPPEVDQWEVRMHETARHLMGQLDSKMRALQALIAEADRAAARLEAVLGEPDKPPRRVDRAEGLASVPPTSPAPPAAPKTPHQPAESRREEIYTLADYGYDAPEIARRVGSAVGEVELVLRLRTEGRGSGLES